ncbi:MAG TPA: class I SAM-dependent methyltransferase [Usitatibacter sp.]|nr:class I SAM-dependent methyltransferase [Usitatibacter sp.]
MRYRAHRDCAHQYLKGGRYVGFDIVPHGIEWCREKITPRYPHFEFFVADIQNGIYNPDGKVGALEYRFPFEDRSFDFVFLTSVFTHMPYNEVEHYAHEIVRVLDKGGRCFCTAFVIGEEALRHLDDGSSGRPFKDTGQGYWIQVRDDPMQAVAYEEQVLRELFAHAGLEILTVLPDSWWSNPYAQDTLVLRKV